MKKYNLWKRLKIAGRLLLSNKPLAEAYDEGVGTVFNDYKEFRETISPLIDKMFDESWRESNGITSALDPHILTRVRLSRLGDAFGSMIATEAAAPEREMMPRFEEIHYTPQRIQQIIRLDKVSASQLGAVKRSTCNMLAKYLYENDFVKYQMLATPHSPYGEVVFFINTVQK